MKVLICWVLPFLIGPDSYFESFVHKKVTNVHNMQIHLADLDNPQVALHLLRSCLGQCKIAHLLRTLPPGSASESFLLFDSNLRSSLESILCSSLDSTAWHQATLPICLGGLGIRSAANSSLPAFLGSRFSSRDIFDHLTAQIHSKCPSFDQEETVAIAQLHDILHDTDPCASQKSIQRALDLFSLSQRFTTSEGPSTSQHYLLFCGLLVAGNPQPKPRPRHAPTGVCDCC